MERMQLGRSPVCVSEAVFGSMAIGAARHDEALRVETIRAAIDAGMTTVDTAPLYDFGACEQQLGRAIRGIRDQVQVFSKIGLRWDDPRGEIMFTCDDEFGNPRAVRRNCRPDSLRVEIERSLRRLGIDTIDCLHVHQLDPQTPIADTMGTLKDFLQEGKIRSIGVSTNYGVKEVIEAQRALGDVPLASVQVYYSPIDRGFEDDLMPLAREKRISVLAHSSLERGLLTGKLTGTTKLDPSDFRRLMPKCHPSNIARVSEALNQVVAPIAERHDASIAQVILAWVKAQPTVTSVVVGASLPSQARANAQAMDLPLRPIEVLAIRRVFEDLEIDPYAGLSVATRVAGQARRVVGGVRRRVVKALEQGLRQPAPARARLSVP